jgi:hypothetical protein
MSPTSMDTVEMIKDRDDGRNDGVSQSVLSQSVLSQSCSGWDLMFLLGFKLF